MQFNSLIFWIFFAVVLLLARLLPHRGQNRMLLVASYGFYAWWDWRFLSLIVISTCVDYFAGLRISTSQYRHRKKALCILSVCVNLGILGIFKYYGFFADQLAHVLGVMGLTVGPVSRNIVLPLGISFYTFQTMSYTIDVYGGRAKPERNFFDFALYVSFFPQLVAGPIERASRLLPQITSPRTCTSSAFSEGLLLIITGLFKKIVIADNMAPLVNAIFARDTPVSGIECWVAVYAFALQIYGDFSGYSAIARGTARWLGFDLMTNFRMPYLASSPSEFWRRWHISLSTWLRDYLYIPMGGNRHGTAATYRNIAITMLLGGLWHGANWTFVAWGAYHGALLIAFRPFEKMHADKVSHTLPLRVLKTVVFFHLVCLGWLLFRSDTIGQATTMARFMFTDFTVTPMISYGAACILFFAGPLLLLEAWYERSSDLLRLIKIHWIPRALVYCYFVLMILIFQPEANNVFIYFRF